MLTSKLRIFVVTCLFSKLYTTHIIITKAFDKSDKLQFPNHLLNHNFK